jgi:hypothetical protein
MQVHTNKESHEKQSGKKSGPNRAKTGLGQLAQPIPGPVRCPFDLAASRAIYSPLAENHAELYSSSAAEEQRREGHHPGEERVKMVD